MKRVTEDRDEVPQSSRSPGQPRSRDQLPFHLAVEALALGAVVQVVLAQVAGLVADEARRLVGDVALRAKLGQ